MNGVDDPLANPTSLGDVWIGRTKPTFVVSELNAMTETIDELQRLRAMRDALIALRNDRYWISCMNPELQTIHRGIDKVIALIALPGVKPEAQASPKEEREEHSNGCRCERFDTESRHEELMNRLEHIERSIDDLAAETRSRR